ncbi:hypothetical protein IC229_03920 [Spirosoma sp. BT702]|uniref:Uncharacterized protein n=1 Tax=Spirosoma profusum TaxID=2771354 RepID=A0A926Y0M5_9BACT|nr:hypothetical protein [Spirosoma profusum]MBD2699770.1 hypothetical protein [Spirosoma profusum]
MKQFVTRYFLLFVLLLAVVIAFAMKATIFQNPKPPPSQPATLQLDFGWNAEEGAYWAGNLLEVNTYRLEQAYKGVLNAGEATLVFTVESILPNTLSPADNDENAILTLKSNLTRRFGRGTSDGSFVTSVLTPVHNPIFPNTLVVNTSKQLWEGYGHQQLTYRDNAYQVQTQPSDTKEADQPQSLVKTRLEDELWNRIRLEPDKLPTGEIQLIPGTAITQLRNIPLKTLPAKATLADYEGVLYPGKFLKSYILEYPTDDRTMVFVFEGKFPHKIVGWEEEYRTQDNLLTSRAVLVNTVQTDKQNRKVRSDSTLHN